MKNQVLFLMLLGLTALLSCKGEQGDPGPAGVAGTNGVDGTNGADGNANIKNYATTINSTDWVGSNLTRKATISVPNITQEILNTGLIMVYTQDAFSSQWYATPFSVAINANTTWSYHYVADVGQIVYHSTSNDGNPFTGNLNIRIVTASADGLVRNPDLDWSEYNEVIRAIYLND